MRIHGRKGARVTARVLITGGAGFTGSHVADELLRHEYRVRALDTLEDQVRPDGERQEYLDPEAEHLDDAVFHSAARVAVRQRMPGELPNAVLASRGLMR